MNDPDTNLHILRFSIDVDHFEPTGPLVDGLLPEDQNFVQYTNVGVGSSGHFTTEGSADTVHRNYLSHLIPGSVHGVHSLTWGRKLLGMNRKERIYA